MLVTAASVGDRVGGKQVLTKVKQMGTAVSRLHTIWVDGGYDGNPFMQEDTRSEGVSPERSVCAVMHLYRWIVQVVLHSQETKGFVLLPKRWVVERTFGWLTGCRRLNKDSSLTN